jgi:hypothetical protein
MKPWAYALPAFAMAAQWIVATAHGESDPSTATVIATATRASGGLAAARAIAALEYRLHIIEATFEVDAVYVVDRRGRMRIDVSVAGRRVYTECFDGTHAWQMDRDGVVTASSPDGKAALWHGTQNPGQILALAELPAFGHRVELAGVQTIDGTAYDVLRLTLSDGFVGYRYLDRRTHLIARGRDTTALHPDVDATRIPSETIWSDYRRIDGVMRPFLSTHRNVATGQWLQTVRVIGIRRLPSLPDDGFVPGSVRAPAR